MIMILIGIILAIVRSETSVTGEPIFKTDENRELYQLFLFFEVFGEVILFFTGMYKDLFNSLF